jgi:hypothetical protein
MRLLASERPWTCEMRSLRSAAAGSARERRPSERRKNPTSGRLRASDSTTVQTAVASALTVPRKPLRTGRFRNRSRASTVVPRGCAADVDSTTSPAKIRTRAPRESRVPCLRVMSVRSETAPMACSASPRKPKEATLARSSAVRILLVACSVTARPASSGDIPEPSSLTRIREIPPSSISTSILLAPASREFSINSLTAEAGRSMTSPAAILCATSGESTRTSPA